MDSRNRARRGRSQVQVCSLVRSQPQPDPTAELSWSIIPQSQSTPEAGELAFHSSTQDSHWSRVHLIKVSSVSVVTQGCLLEGVTCADQKQSTQGPGMDARIRKGNKEDLRILYAALCPWTESWRLLLSICPLVLLTLTPELGCVVDICCFFRCLISIPLFPLIIVI